MRKKTGKVWKIKMKKKLVAITAGMCAVAMLFTGCSSEISNDYITISQYKGIEVPAVEFTEVTDEVLQEEINYMMESSAEYVDITDRAAKLGDWVTIDYVGRLNGEAFDGGTAEGYELELGSGTFIDGFEDGIVGKKIGDVFKLDLTFPDNYGSAELAGKDVVFEVALNSITEVKLPELTDEWVQSVSTTSKTVDEYKDELRTMLQEYYTETAQAQLEESVWEQFMANTTVNKYDTEELQELIALTQDQYKSMAEDYEMEFGEFIEAYAGVTEEEFNAEVSTLSKERLKEKYAVELVIEKAKIEVTDEKKLPVYEQYLEYFGFETVEEMKAAFEDAGTLESLEQEAETQIVKEWLVEHCKQVETKEGSEE